MNRKDRLREVYEYLRNNGYVHTQKAFADKLGKAEGTMSKAFKGDEKSLTDNLFVQVTLSFPNLFNLNYLLTGEGTLLVGPETVDEKSINVSYKDTEVDMLKKKIEILEDTIKRQKSMIDQYESFVDLLMRQNKNAENNLREGYVSEGGIQASVYDSKK